MAIVGLGLIGGSLACDLTRLGHEVIGVDRRGVLRAARRRGLIASGAASLEALPARVRTLVLAAPPAANRRLLARLARLGRPELVVTDVGSVKAGIVADARRLRLARFVGGHPMAGSERSGLAAARPGLFAGRPWLLTPGRATDPAALRRVRALVRAVDARPRLAEAGQHDRALAFLSHVPQLVSQALLQAARRDPVARRHLRAAGPGFRDMTRLARSPRALWREIFRENALELRRALRALGRELSAAE